MSNRSSQGELPTKSTANTPSFLKTCVLDAGHKALEEHLVNNQVHQNDLDRSLLQGLQTVQRKESELSHVAPALTILLQSDAIWNTNVLLDDQKTPLHIICESPGDHHELLDLMIKSSRRTLIDTQDIDEYTALLYAVRNANVNCVKCLIAHGADVNIGYNTDAYMYNFSADLKVFNPIMEAIKIMSLHSGHSSTVIVTDIFDLLLDAAIRNKKVYFSSRKTYILCAVAFRNVHCVLKLITTGAPLDIINCNNYYVWELVASMGNVELLKCMINHGIDKNTANKRSSILWNVYLSDNIEAVRYLLDIGVTVPSCPLEERTTHCEKCKENMLIMRDYEWDDHDPCLGAIRVDNVEMVKLFDEYGSPTCKSFAALRCAMKSGGEGVLTYLLSKHTYPLNIEYSKKDSSNRVVTLLTDPYIEVTPGIIKILLDHGADPAKQMCSATSVNAIMAATKYNRPLGVIAQYIRSGVDINCRSKGNKCENNLSLFKLSVQLNRPYISAMLLISGCSHGVFNNRNFKPNLEKLMKEWNVYDNNVIPLQQRCRCVILNHLSPQADLKIKKLPLPPRLIKFLNIPELDNIVHKYSKAVKE